MTSTMHWYCPGDDSGKSAKNPYSIRISASQGGLLK